MPEFAELLRGYRRFRERDYPHLEAKFGELVAGGQHPKLMIIGCSDSRVNPAQIFDVDPGDIFVVRNVAALVPPTHSLDDLDAVAAAVEFAVGFLEVRQIVVMGHSQCGGCKAALDGTFDGRAEGSGAFIARWAQLLREAREYVRSDGADAERDREQAMEHAAVHQSLANLRSFPWVSQREAAGALTLRGTWFSLSDGVLHHLDEETGAFAPL